MFDGVGNIEWRSQGYRWLTRSFVVWLALMAAETLNGAIRELFVVPILGDMRARQLSMAVALVVILLITMSSIKWIGASGCRLFVIGAIWSFMSVCFEFMLAAAVTGRPWEDFKRDYNITAGGQMPLGLVFLLFAPLLAVRIRGIFGRGHESQLSRTL